MMRKPNDPNENIPKNRGTSVRAMNITLHAFSRLQMESKPSSAKILLDPRLRGEVVGARPPCRWTNATLELRQTFGQASNLVRASVAKQQSANLLQRKLLDFNHACSKMDAKMTIVGLYSGWCNVRSSFPPSRLSCSRRRRATGDSRLPSVPPHLSLGAPFVANGSQLRTRIEHLSNSQAPRMLLRCHLRSALQRKFNN